MTREQASLPAGGFRARTDRRSTRLTRRAAMSLVAVVAVLAGRPGWAQPPERQKTQAPAPGTPAPLNLPRAPEVPAGAPTAPPSASPAPAAAPAQAAPGAAPVGDLITKYRFQERYAAELDRISPGEIGQYRVASRDVIRVATDRPQGSPERTEQVVQLIYTERPSAMSSLGQVSDTVRRFDALRTTPAPPGRPSPTRPLEGLVVWFKTRPGGIPEILSLVEGRSITETEYSIARRQLFMPDLSAVLPVLPSRVGDRWRLPRPAIQTLLGGRPMSGGEPIVGTLQDVRKAANGQGMVATIAVTGRAVLPQAGETVLNAQIVFSFTPVATDPAAAPEGGAEGQPGVVDARGAITEVRLARAANLQVPGSNGRLRSNLTWELTLVRQLGTGTPLVVPPQAPEPTEANSWLVYDDPQGRFHFRHPQTLLTQRPPVLARDDEIQLGDSAAGSDQGRILTLRLQPKSDDPAEDKANRDPDSHLKELKEEWQKSGQDVIPGPTGWLPEVDWAPVKMRVYRIEAALKPKGPENRDLTRIFLDYYLVLFTQNESLVVTAMTGQDQPLPFRKEVETILHTFKLGPSKSAATGESTAVPPGGTTPVTPAQPAITPPGTP